MSNPEQLIASGEGPAAISAGGARFVVAVFIGVLGGAAVVDAFFPKVDVQPVGAEWAALQEQRQSARFADGSLARLGELELRSSSRVRQTLVPWWSAVLLRTTGAALGRLVVGEGNALFLRNRIEVPRGEPRDLAELGVRTIAAMERRLEAAGTRMVAIPVPRKAAVCAELLAQGVDSRPEVDRALIDGLLDAGVETVDLVDAWRGMDPLDVYMRHDTHWGSAGQRAAARAIAALVGGKPTIGLALEIDRIEPEDAALLQMTGIPPGSRAARWLSSASQARYRLEPVDADAAARERSTWQDRVLVGSSFTHNRDLSLMVSHDLGALVWNQGYHARPFPEQVERFFRFLGARPIPRLLLWEFPAHEVLVGAAGPRASNRAALGLTWSRIPSVAGTIVAADTLGDPPLAVRRGQRVVFPPGRVSSSGDGVLGIRITGALEKTRWSVASGAMGFSFEWPRNRSEVLLPIVHEPRDRAGVVVTSVNGANELDRAVVSLEVIGASRTLEEGVISTVRDGQAWSDELLNEALPLPEHGALLLRATPKTRAGELEITATSEDGSVRAWRLFTARGGVVAVSLQPLAGAALTSITVRTQGGRPAIEGRSWAILVP